MSAAKLFVLVILVGLLATLSSSFRTATVPLENIPSLVKSNYQTQLDSLGIAVFRLEKGIQSLSKQTLKENRRLYLACRSRYKKVEVFLAYYTPQAVDQLNGALITEVEEDDPNQSLIKPEGLQVVESLLWSDSAWLHQADLSASIHRIQIVLNRIKALASISEFRNDQLFSAMQQEIIRIISLGLAGFDTPNSGNAIAECRDAYQGVLQLYLHYQPYLKEKEPVLYARSLKYIERLKAAFLFNESFDNFNRAYFISQVSNPFYSIVTETQQCLKIPPANKLALRSDATTIFASDSWNTSRFVSYQPKKSSPLLINLGKMLFFDPILSGNGKRACASCHQPEKAFTDAKATSRPFSSEGTVKRNAPTIINSALQANLFWDSRVNFLEDQVSTVIQNPNEMHGSFEHLTSLLNQSPEYVLVFKSAFQGTEDTVISSMSICKAIAAYERSLIGFDSKFDRYMRGDQSAMNAQEIAGFNIFMGRGQCGTCHFLPTFGGTVPPLFERTEWEVLGTPKNIDQKEMDSDPGRFDVQGILLHKGAFKTPSLRNVALTAPYMHNGVYTSLEQVIEFYKKGGGKGLGYVVGNQTLPDNELKLKNKAVLSLIAFMNTLTDTSRMTARPDHLPLFTDPELNKRKTGGEY